MSGELDALSEEIERYLAQQQFLIFRGYPETGEARLVAHWDTENYPDYREFLELGKQLGARVVLYYVHRLTTEALDEAGQDLEAADLDEQQYLSLRARLRALRSYEGSVGWLELCYLVDGVAFLYRRRTDWFMDFHRLLQEIQEAGFDEAGDDDQDIDEFFSRN